MIEIIVITLTTVLLFLIFCSIDQVITKKRLEQNQREWDEFSKDMTDRDKLQEYLPFVYSQRAKYGWGYYYLPKMRKGENK